MVVEFSKCDLKEETKSFPLQYYGTSDLMFLRQIFSYVKLELM